MKVILITCLLQVFTNPQLHTAGSSQNESIDGTAKAPPPDQTTSQEPLAASVAEPSVTVTEKASRSANHSREGHAVAHNTSTPLSAEKSEQRMSSGHKEDDAIPPTTDAMGVHNRSDTSHLPNPSENATHQQTSSLAASPTPTPPPPQSPPINTPSSPEGGEEVLTFEEFKKKREQEMPRPPELESPPQLPLNKAKNNYASFECGARVIKTNEEAQNPMAILTENKDAYMLNPCKANISFTVELCDTVRILKLELGCFELFSSVPETFRVYSSERHPTDEWNFMGEFNASNERVLQSFVPKESAYAKFVKVEMVSHYGNEHYCPISVFRVIGASLVEEFEYSEARKTIIVAASSDDESDEYLHLGEEQGPGNGRLLDVAKDAVLSLLEPFSRLGNGLIHKDRGSSCTDSSCTPGDVLPPATQSPLIEKGQDAGVSPMLETQQLSDQMKVEQVPSVSGTVGKSDTVVNSGGEQDAFSGGAGAERHGNVTALGPSGTALWERTDHSDTPTFTIHTTPSSTGTPALPTSTDSARFQTSAGQEGSVWTPLTAEQQPSVGSPSDAAGPFVIPGQEGSSLAPALPQATPAASEQQQEAPGVLLEGGVVVTPNFPNGTSSKGVPPDGTSSKGVPPDGISSKGVPSDGTSSKGVPSDGTSSKGVPLDGTSSKGVPPDGTSSKGVPPDGTSSKGVPPDGTSSKGVPPDGTSSKGIPSDGIMLGPHSVDTPGPVAPPVPSSVGPRSSLESVTTPQPETQEDAKPGPHTMHGKGDGEEEGSEISADNKATPILDASTAVHTVPPLPTLSSPSQSHCITSSSTPSTDGDSPLSSSPPSPPSPSIPSVGSNLPPDSTNESHPQWVVGAVGGGAGGGAAQDHGSIMPAPGSVSREKSVLLRLNERVKNVEENVSLLSSYMEQVTNSLRKNKNKTDEVQKALDRNLQTLSEAMQELNATISTTVQRLKRVEEELQSKSFDSIEMHLESIGKTVLNQQLLLFTLSCLTAVLMLLLIVLVLFLCLIRGCGQRTSQRVRLVGTPPPVTAVLKSNVKRAHSIGGGVVLEDMAVYKAAQHSRINLTLNHENTGLLEKKKRKGKRNSH